MECWREAGLCNLVHYVEISLDSFAGWLFKFFQVATALQRGKTAMILWGIWRRRNNLAWNGVANSARVTVTSALDFLCSWAEARNLNLSSSNPSPRLEELVHWKKPLAPFVKCNVDAAIFQWENAMGVGIIVRDADGHFVACKSMKLDGIFQVKEAEN